MTIEAPPAAEAAITLQGLDHAVDGYLHGLTQPFLQARIALNLPAVVNWDVIEEAVRTLAAGAAGAQTSPGGDPLAEALTRLVHWTAQLQRVFDDGVYEPGRILWRTGAGASVAVVALPTIDPTTATAALRVVIGLVNRGLGGGVPVSQLIDGAKDDLRNLEDAQRHSRVIPEMILFMGAAHERNVPWIRLGTSTVFQFGHGHRAQWMDCTLIESDSLLGGQITQNKAVTTTVLRQFGLPAPAHFMATSEDMAVSAAEKLGYPVVVKPLDMMQGKGVQVNLKTPEAVRKAFTQARKLSQRVLVESFIEGRDFRLTVFKGKLLWAIERAPGYITGDGVHTVRRLVDQLNEERRISRALPKLKPILFDSEAEEMLAARGMDGGSIPAAGENIRLRGAANMARGGRAVAVMDIIHPDNRRLAELAAEPFHVDVLGVDLLITDITRSWKEIGGGICEVNVRPDFHTVVAGHVYGKFMDAFIEGDGRIPIGLALGVAAGSKACELAVRIVAASGKQAGGATADRVWIGDQELLTDSTDAFGGARRLLFSRKVEAAVVAVSDTRPASTGLPFDRCNVIALAGAVLAGSANGEADFLNLAQSMAPMCAGSFVVNAEDSACMRLAANLPAGRVILYAAEIGSPELAKHRARGGAAVWVEATAADGPCVVISPRPESVMRVHLDQDHARNEPLICEAGDVALAVSMAGALGCGEGHLRQGLAGVRIRA